MKALIVWETVPDKTEMYLVNINGQEERMLRTAHDKYINGTDDEDVLSALEKINGLLDEEWANKKVDGPCMGRPDIVVVCGFIM